MSSDWIILAVIIIVAYSVAGIVAELVINRLFGGWIGHKCDEGGQWLLMKAKERKAR